MPTANDTARKLYLQLLDEKRRELRLSGAPEHTNVAELFGPDTTELLEIYVTEAINHLYENSTWDPRADAAGTAFQIAGEYARNKLFGVVLFGTPVWKARVKQWLAACAMSR